MVIIRRLAAVYFTLLLGGITAAHQAAAPAVTPGELIVEPTLINLGFEWLIDGDSKRRLHWEGTGPRRDRSGSAIADLRPAALTMMMLALDRVSD